MKSILGTISVFALTFGVLPFVEAGLLTECTNSSAGTAVCYDVHLGNVTFDYERGLPILVDEVPTTAEGTTLSSNNSIAFEHNTLDFTTTASIAIDGLFGSWGSTSSNYSGSRALFNNLDNGVTKINIFESIDVRPSYASRHLMTEYATFDFVAIDISELLNDTLYGPTSITFSGELSTGSVVSQTVLLDGVFGLETFTFGDTFMGVKSVWWDQAPDWHQFDNVVLENVTVRVVPIPASVWLFGSGLIGLIGAARRKKS